MVAYLELKPQNYVKIRSEAELKALEHTKEIAGDAKQCTVVAMLINIVTSGAMA